MILYNASTGDGIRNFARRFSKSDDSSYTDIELDASINRYYDIFVTEIIQAQDDWDFQEEIATSDLVADQQEYVFPTDILKIKRIEISYDGSKWQNVTFFDINERGRATDTTTVSQDFNQNEPYADIKDSSIFIFPIPSANSTGGIKIEYSKLPTQLSAVTDEPVIARPFHIGLAYGAAKDHLEEEVSAEGNDVRLSRAISNFEETMRKAKAFYRRRIQDRPYTVKGAFVDYGYENFNRGSNRLTPR